MPDIDLKLDVHDSMHDLSDSSINFLRNVELPFLNYDWFYAFSEYVCHALGKQKWLVLSEAGETLAILPMVSQKRGKYRVLQSMSNYYSPYFDIIAPSAPRQHLLTRMVAAAADFLEQFDIVEFLPECEEVRDAFVYAFDRKIWNSHCYQHSLNWRHHKLSNFQDYWEQRPTRLKSTVQRRGQKLKKLPHQFKIFSGILPDQALADYHSVYFNSWKNNEPFPAFIDAIARSASSREILRMGILYINGKPAAAQLWFVKSGTAYIFKLAYDAEYQNLSVGSLLSAELFKHVIEYDKVTTIDYLTGNDSYKADWMNEKRTLSGLQFTNSLTYCGKLATIKNRAGKMLQGSPFS